MTHICVNLEFRNSLLEFGCFAGSMVVPTILLFFLASFEDQVCQNDGNDRRLEAIGLAVLSGLGHRYTHPGR